MYTLNYQLFDTVLILFNRRRKIPPNLNTHIQRLGNMLKYRKPNMFERVLLVVGILVMLVGFYLINKVFVDNNSELSWQFLQTVFLWLMLVIFIIIIAISEDIKQTMMENHSKQLELLREDLKRRR